MEQKWKRPLALLLSVAMMFSMSGTPVYAADMETGASAVCPHHVHDETCGYSEGTPCTHEHTDDCYTLVTQCVHEHTAECYSDGILPAEGEEKAADACTHVCSEESGCITKELNCPHVHDETCGYSEGSPCTFDPSDCELCNPTDSGEPEAPAECTCETLCTADSVNPDCPVCGAEGADLAACAGTVEEGDAAEETDPAQNPAEQTILSWEWIGNAREHFSVGDRILVRVLRIQREDLEHITIQVDARSVSATTSHDNLKKCMPQSSQCQRESHFSLRIRFILITRFIPFFIGSIRFFSLFTRLGI